MKQWITIEQLRELSEEEQKILRYWLIEHHASPFFVDAFESCLTPIPQNTEYLPNIGQMIEFLDEHEPSLKIKGRRMTKSFLVDVPDNTMVWDIEGNQSTIDDEINLCDALWEAVKEVLEKE